MAGTWIEVDIDALLNNYQEITRHLRPESKCMAIVKADAYGLGAVQTAIALEQAGCEAFGVTKVEEGLILRKHGVKGMILTLGPSLKEEWAEAIKADLQLTISEISLIEPMNDVCMDLDRDLFVQIKLETGMGRTGFRLSELEALTEALAKAPRIKPVGVYTHFARAAQRDKRYTLEQYERFKQLTTRLKELGIEPKWKHVCNSAAFLDYPEWHHDFVRIGTLLIGHYPGPNFTRKLALQDPWQAKSRVVHLRQVPKGTYVGYQSLYRAKSTTRLAVIPVGYADGFGLAPHFVPQGWLDFCKIIVKNFLALFGIYLGQEKIELNGRIVPVAGKIGMQLTVLDVGMGDCSLGDEVKVPLRRTVANPRLEIVYRKNGIIFSRRSIEEGVSHMNTEYQYTQNLHKADY